jgi:hypothetical protein
VCCVYAVKGGEGVFDDTMFMHAGDRQNHDLMRIHIFHPFFPWSYLRRGRSCVRLCLCMRLVCWGFSRNPLYQNLSAVPARNVPLHHAFSSSHLPRTCAMPAISAHTIVASAHRLEAKVYNSVPCR